MQTDGLIEALKAAIDEDERIARATMLTTNDDGDWIVSTNPDCNDAVTGVLGQCIHIGLIDGNGDLDVPEQAFHIARQNPARTLAMVAAHREILGLCQVWIAIDELPVGAIEGRDQDEITCDSAIAVNARQLLAALTKGYGIEADQ